MLLAWRCSQHCWLVWNLKRFINFSQIVPNAAVLMADSENRTYIYTYTYMCVHMCIYKCVLYIQSQHIYVVHCN